MMVEKLGMGDVFPSLSLKIAGGGTINLPEVLDTPLTVVLFYRGYW
jgi:peroxiredoxin